MARRQTEDLSNMEVFLPTQPFNPAIELEGAVCIYRALSIAATSATTPARGKDCSKPSFEALIEEIDADIVAYDGVNGTTELACRVVGCEAKNVIVQPDYEGPGYLKVVRAGTLPSCVCITEQ